MLLAIDVHYHGDNSARAAGVEFAGWLAEKPSRVQVVEMRDAKPYQPGSFYLRELPALLSVVTAIGEEPEAVLIDGYVWLSRGKPGLGAHLWEGLNRRVPVIGVAKNPFRDTPAVRVYRRGARKPLFVTSAGIRASKAARAVVLMPGPYRLPTMLRMADNLARESGPGRS